jgi:hypothetical protein
VVSEWCHTCVTVVLELNYLGGWTRRGCDLCVCVCVRMCVCVCVRVCVCVYPGC